MHRVLDIVCIVNVVLHHSPAPKLHHIVALMENAFQTLVGFSVHKLL
jgi:hypothetical protein